MRSEQERAARLWESVEGIEERIGIRLLTQERARYEPFVAGPCEACPTAFDEGRLTPLQEVIKYALSDPD